MDAHIFRQQPRQAAHQAGGVAVDAAGVQGCAGDVQVGDLAAGVYPGVGAPGHAQLGRGPQHQSQCLLQGSLHGAQGRIPLFRPAMELGPVIGQVQA